MVAETTAAHEASAWDNHLHVSFCSGKTRLALPIPSSHELESVNIIIIIIIIIILIIIIIILILLLMSALHLAAPMTCALTAARLKHTEYNRTVQQTMILFMLKVMV